MGESAFTSHSKAKEKFSIPPETNMYVLDGSGTEVDEEVFSDILEEKADILWTIVNVLSVSGWDSDMASLLLVYLLPPPPSGKKGAVKISTQEAVDHVVKFHKGAELHQSLSYRSLRTISSHGMMIISETLSNGVHFDPESINNAYRVSAVYGDGTAFRSTLVQTSGGSPTSWQFGTTRKHIHEFYVALDGDLLPCKGKSSLSAFDELFKAHYVFGISYDQALNGMYTFVQTTIYNINVILRMIAADFLVFSTILSEVTWRRGSLWSLYDTEAFTNAHRQKEPLINVVGDLRKKNCTSVMMNLTSQHSDRYFFRFSSEGFSVTATKAVQINGSDSLAEPYVIVPGLREGEVGNLTCTVPAPCPSNSPNVTWDPAFGGNITQWTQLNADGTQNVSAILNFVPSFHHHELKVNCVSIHLLDRQDKPLLSHKTIILNVESVHRWFMKKHGIVEEVGALRVLSFTATHSKSGEYICEAQNLHGAGNSTILQITVPGKSFTAFLAVLALFSLLLFALPIVLIYRRCKKNTQKCKYLDMFLMK
ncbi:unnamed protein product [Leuciscus chuanchicus]